MMSDWKWYSGSNDKSFDCGPFDTKEQAVAEAMHSYAFEEREDEVDIITDIVHVTQAKGTYWDCGECGEVSEACSDCGAYLEPDEPHFFFKHVQNYEQVVVGKGRVGELRPAEIKLVVSN